MNFLAHLYFADDSAESMIGNLVPDFVRGRERSRIHPALADGVGLHRHIDAIADTHPIPLGTRRLLRPRHGLFAPILVDVFYDHALAAQWHRWHEQTLEQFVSHAYRTMLAAEHLMPVGMGPIIARMAEQDWLGSYADVAGMHARLSQMSERFEQRFGRTFDASAAMDDLRRLAPTVNEDFRGFFPQLIAQVRPAVVGI